MIPKIVITIEGGMVQGVHANGSADVLIIDFDLCGGEEFDRNRIGEPCYKSAYSIRKSNTSPWIEEEFALMEGEIRG